MDRNQYHYTSLSKDEEALEASTLNTPLAGPSEPSNAPPTFEESLGHVAVDIDRVETFVPQGGEEPPPAFTPYEAEYSVSSSGNITSHDPHLNKDGEALYRFLLSHASTPPTYMLHCSGTHDETRTRFVHTSDAQGKPATETETYHETVTDFDFYIDVGCNIISDPVHWSVADSEPAYRGSMVRQIESSALRRKADRDERALADAWKKEREGKGLPPWIGPEWQDRGVNVLPDTNVLKSSRTLRQWADEYCESPKYLKEFLYEKIVYGWNIQSLTDAIRSAITSTHYHGLVNVRFEGKADKIRVRSDNVLSRTLSNKWIKFLLVITLIYFPFIWLFKRFHPRGGGRWEVCGGAYALKCWRIVDEHDPNVSAVTDNDWSIHKSWPGPTLVGAPGGGTLKLVGTREGEWFKHWESTIRNSVTSRVQSREPLQHPGIVNSNPAALSLDGYM